VIISERDYRLQSSTQQLNAISTLQEVLAHPVRTKNQESNIRSFHPIFNCLIENRASNFEVTHHFSKVKTNKQEGILQFRIFDDAMDFMGESLNGVLITKS